MYMPYEQDLRADRRAAHLAAIIARVGERPDLTEQIATLICEGADPDELSDAELIEAIEICNTL